MQQTCPTKLKKYKVHAGIYTISKNAVAVNRNCDCLLYTKMGMCETSDHRIFFISNEISSLGSDQGMNVAIGDLI